MLLEREKLDELFAKCYTGMDEFEKEEFTKFCFVHLYFIMCVVNNPLDEGGIEKFNKSIRMNLTDDRLEYIRQFFRESVKLF